MHVNSNKFKQNYLIEFNKFHKNSFLFTQMHILVQKIRLKLNFMYSSRKFLCIHTIWVKEYEFISIPINSYVVLIQINSY
jgi:hypothetical protein